MKKSLLTTAATICILGTSITTASCNGNKNNNSQNENVTTSDASSAPANEDEWAKDSLAQVNRTTPDLAFLFLHGPVRTLTENESQVYRFTEDGTILSYNSFDPFDSDPYSDNGFYLPRICMSRDDDGKIVETSGWEWATEYEWKDGKPSAENGGAESTSWKSKYTFNEAGELIKIKGETRDEACEDENPEPIDIEYEYTKYDEYNNWIERNVKTNDAETNNYTEKRIITYYPIERTKGASDKGEFNPEIRQYKFIGSIGNEKDTELVYGPDGGYYMLKSGKRLLKPGYYDPKSGKMVFFAYLGTRYIGDISGKFTNNVFNGRFFNCTNGAEIDVKLKLQEE